MCRVTRPPNPQGYAIMKNAISLAAAFAVMCVSATAFAEQTNPPANKAPATSSAKAPVLTAPPGDSLTVTAWYRQNVYDPQNTKIGQIADVLVGRDGKVTAFVIGAGGF